MGEQDYYKSLVPSQLLAERGEEIVVINPGTTTRCIYLPHVLLMEILCLLQFILILSLTEQAQQMFELALHLQRPL